MPLNLKGAVQHRHRDFLCCAQPALLVPQEDCVCLPFRLRPAQVAQAQKLPVTFLHQEGGHRPPPQGFLIGEFLLDRHMEHGHGQHRIGAGTDGHKEIRLAGRNGVIGVYDDEFGP